MVRLQSSAYRTILAVQGKQRLSVIDYNPLLILENQYQMSRSKEEETLLIKILDEVSFSSTSHLSADSKQLCDDVYILAALRFSADTVRLVYSCHSRNR